MSGILVPGEARAHRCDLEQHPARLAEIHRLEPVAVDDRRRAGAAGDHAIAPRHLLFIERGPGDVMHRTRARHAALARCRVEHVSTAALLVSRLPRGGAGYLESERILQQIAARCGAGGVYQDPAWDLGPA